MGIFWSYEFWNEPRMITFWRTSLAAFFLCVVAAAVYLPQVARTWPLRPLWYLGEVSYGIYLWHMFAVTLLLRIPDLAPPQALAMTLVLTIALAATSWHLIEKPILEYGRRFHGGSGPRRAAAEPAS
jgi:peptidoglycan/LPS O-acetylase OafA/YrhL